MDKCYLCGKEFNDIDVKKHDEHIIQQSIGGNLTVNDILCSSCGGKLGNEVDVPFVNIFEGIATRLDIKQDRKGNNQSTKSVKGKMENIDVIWKDFKVSPVKPFHLYTIDKRFVIIYANEQTAENYKSKKVKKEINENLLNQIFIKSKKLKWLNEARILTLKDFQYQFNEFCKKTEVIICDDMDGLVKFPFNMDEKAFRRGLAKIAVGFASSHDIQREDMPLVLKIDTNTDEAKIQDKIPMIPFYPLGVIDKLIEVQKNEFEYYPFHNIILFTIDYDPKTSKGKKVLICYIELFATFQWYVVLNKEYYGDSIYESYAQQILKKDDYIVELGRRYYKERNIWLQPLGITKEYIDKKHEKHKDKILSKLKWSQNTTIPLITQQANIFLNLKSRFKIEYEIIQEETIKQKYKFDFEGYIQNTISGINNQVLTFKDKEKFSHINNDVTKFLNNKDIVATYNSVLSNFDGYQNFHNNLFLFYSLDYDENEISSIYSFRVFYYQECKLKNYYSELLDNFQLLQNNGSLKDYHHKKMYMLENHIFQENIKRKMKK